MTLPAYCDNNSASISKPTGLTDPAHIREADECYAEMLRLLDSGRAAAASQFALRLVTLMEQELGQSHIEVSKALTNAASVLQAQGDYPQARPMLTRALQIAETNLGADDPYVGHCLNNLGTLLYFQGDYDSALPLFLRTQAIFEKANGAKSPLVADVLRARALILDHQNQPVKALELYQQALAINEADRPDSLELAISLADLANALQAQRKFADAVPLLERSLRIRQQALGANHPDVAESLNNLAMIYANQQNYDAAKKLLEEALSICQKQQGPDHVDAAILLNNISQLDLARNDAVAMRKDLMQASHIIEQYVNNVLPGLSFAEQKAFIDTRIPDQTNKLLRAFRGADISDAYDVVFRWKGLLIDTLRRQGTLHGLESQASLKPELEQLAKLREDIAGWYMQAGCVPLDQWQKRSRQLSQQHEELERKLMQCIPSDVIADPLLHLKLPDIARSLKPDEAVVDIYCYNDETDKYCAVVLAGDTSGGALKPVVVSLPTAERTRSLVSEWRTKLMTYQDAKGSWKLLNENLWKPIAQSLPASTKKVWICPDSGLFRVPWQLLPRYGDNHIDTAIAQVDSVRELIYMRSLSQKQALGENNLLLVGGINFDSTKLPGVDEKSLEKKFDLKVLPGTVDEVKAIGELAATQKISSVQFTGDDATKTRVAQQLPSFSFVHFATHGFFVNLEHLKSTPSPAEPQSDGMQSDAVRNQLVESGIALAGANYWDTKSQNDPGLLSAAELIGQKLTGCQLFTLSACDTGRGEEVSGQGVMGLRSAIIASGAKTIIMSLWKVPDQPTKQLMEAFYRNLWVKKLPKVAALSEAQAETAKSFPSDYAWAGWTLVGEGW